MLSADQVNLYLTGSQETLDQGNVLIVIHDNEAIRLDQIDFLSLRNFF